jgi:cytochrome P450
MSIFQFNFQFNKHLGPIISNFTLYKMILTVREPHLARKILNDPETFQHQGIEMVKHSHKFIGNDNLFMINNPAWKRQRKVFDRGFKNLDYFFSIFMEKASFVIEKKFGNGEIVSNLNEIMRALSLDILGLTILGYEPNSLIHGDDVNFKSYKYLMTFFLDLKTILVNMITIHFEWLESTKETMKQLEIWNKFRSELIEKSKKKILKKEFKPSDYSLLDLMVESHLEDEADEKLSEKEIMDNLGVLLLANNENISNSLAFNVFCLAKYPEIQSKLRKEIHDKIDKISPNQVENLEYMTCFIKEVYRLYPPLCTIPPKITSKEVILGDYFIPKGTLIRISILDIHTNEEFYENPLEFKPERWLESSKKKIPHFAWIPFSGGPRVCIGTRFSIMQQKIFLIQLLMKFEVSMVDGILDFEIDSLSGGTYQKPKEKELKFTEIK